MSELKPITMYCCKSCQHLYHEIVTACDCGTGCDPFEYEIWEARRAKPEPSEAVRDAERWRFRQQFLLDGGAVLWSQRGCQYRDVQGMIICQGRTEEDAIDAAIAAHHAKEKGND